MTRDVLRALGRRWYIVVTGLLMTVALALGAYHITPPSYTASGLILLLPSKTEIGPGGNPFLALSDLDQPAGILVAYFSGASAAADVKTKYPTAKFTVQISTSARGPIIEVDTTDKTRAGTLGALDYITGQIPAELQRLQSQVNTPANAIITSMPLTVDGKAKSDYSATIRMVITATLVGLLVTGVVAFAVDGLLASRRARRQARAEREGSAAQAPPAGPRPPRAPRRTTWRRPVETGPQGPPEPQASERETPELDTPDEVAAETETVSGRPSTEQRSHNEMVSQLSGRHPADTGRES